MKRIFISAPYRAKTQARVERNIERARNIGRRYAIAGELPMVPHLAVGYMENTPEETPMALYHCIELVDLCDELHYFGEPTGGMQMEIAHARGIGIPVRGFPLDCQDSEPELDELMALVGAEGTD